MVKKNLLAILGVAGCGAVWVPQLMSAFGESDQLEETSEDEEPELEYDWSEEPSDEAGGSDAPTEKAAGVDALVGQLESFGGGPNKGLNQADDLERVVAALTAHRAEKAPAAQQTTSTVVDLFPETDGSDDHSFLNEWATGNPLTGLVVPQNETGQASALIGHRVVRDGARLAGGRITVQSITGEGVTLTCGDARALMELPPFIARPASSDGGDEEQGEDGESDSAEAPMPEEETP